MWNKKNQESIQTSWNFLDSNKKENRINKFNDFLSSYNSINMTFEEFKNSATNDVFNDIKKQGPNNYIYALSEMCSDVYLNRDGTINIYEDVIKSLDDIILKIKDLDRLKDMKNNFNWSINNSDDVYSDLEEEINNMFVIESLSNTLNEIEQYVKEHKNMVFYSFTYSDEGGTYSSIMEHGGIFGDLPVYVESNH